MCSVQCSVCEHNTGLRCGGGISVHVRWGSRAMLIRPTAARKKLVLWREVLVKLHTQSHCVLPALGVPGVNRKPLVSIMQSHLSLQLHRSIHVHFKSRIHRVEESLCAACVFGSPAKHISTSVFVFA